VWSFSGAAKGGRRFLDDFAQALGRYRAFDALPWLRRTSGSQDLRRRAAVALAMLGDDSGRAVMVQESGRRTLPVGYWERELLLEALRRIGSLPHSEDRMDSAAVRGR
jgi:hypothetical protein